MEKESKYKLTSYLSFKLGDEIFAANVSKVLNILEMVKITKVPKCPEFMKGVINLRGAILPVIDTRIKLGMSETVNTANTCILVLEIESNGDTIQIGGLVDAVQEVLEIEHSQVLPPPNIGSKYHSEFIYGMYKMSDEQFIMLLEIDKLFTSEDISELKISTVGV